MEHLGLENGYSCLVESSGKGMQEGVFIDTGQTSPARLWQRGRCGTASDTQSQYVDCHMCKTLSKDVIISPPDIKSRDLLSGGENKTTPEFRAWVVV